MQPQRSLSGTKLFLHTWPLRLKRRRIARYVLLSFILLREMLNITTAITTAVAKIKSCTRTPCTTMGCVMHLCNDFTTADWCSTPHQQLKAWVTLTHFIDGLRQIIWQLPLSVLILPSLFHKAGETITFNELRWVTNTSEAARLQVFCWPVHLCKSLHPSRTCPVQHLQSVYLDTSV